MIDHSPVAFTAEKFFESIPKVRNAELHYSAINFFLEEEPALLGKLLQVLTPKLDHSRVVHQLRKAPVSDALQLVLPYLRAVQARAAPPACNGEASTHLPPAARPPTAEGEHHGRQRGR